MKHEFYNLGELEEAQHQLARATAHPVYVDLQQQREGASATPGRDSELVPERQIIYNNRDERVSYFASDDYVISQHSEVIDLIRSAVSATTGEIDFGMIRDDGEIVDGVIVFGGEAQISVADLLGDDYIPPDQQPESDPRAEETWRRDVCGLGMRFGNSFNGSRKVTGSTMGYRYICQNWMVWGEQTIGTVEHKHINELDEAFFMDIIGEVFATRDEVESLIIESEEDLVPLDWVDGILENKGFGKNYRTRIIRELSTYNQPEEEHTTLWRLYNAITHDIDHNCNAGQGTFNWYHQRAAEVLAGEFDRDEPVDSRALGDIVA